jgi:RNA polymerase sigma-70 factor (ECF subfamily)
VTATTLAEVDAEARFAELLERHRGIVFKVATTYCRNPADREDVAQEIVTQLWRAFPKFDATRSFSTWVYRIALNVAISDDCSGSERSVTLALAAAVPAARGLRDVVQTCRCRCCARRTLRIDSRGAAGRAAKDRDGACVQRAPAHGASDDGLDYERR